MLSSTPQFLVAPSTICIDCGAKWPLAKEQKEKKRANGRSYKKGGKIQTGLNEKL
jgi:hypothetical protein